MRLLERRLDHFSDGETLTLFRELQLVSRICPKSSLELGAYQFLDLCMHPSGGMTKQIRITKERIGRFDDFDSFLLLKTVGKVNDELHRLFSELAQNRGESIDNFGGTSIFMFLNRMTARKRARSVSWYNF